MLKFTTTIFILTFTLTSCSSLNDTGTNTFIKESSNKQHDKKAILFLKEAVATVADSYQVTVCGNNIHLAEEKLEILLQLTQITVRHFLTQHQ